MSLFRLLSLTALTIALNTNATTTLSSVSTETWAIPEQNSAVFLDYTYLTSTSFYSTVYKVDLATSVKTKLLPLDNSLPSYISFGYSKSHLTYIAYTYSSGGSGGGGGGGGGKLAKSAATSEPTNLMYYNLDTKESKQLITDGSYKESVCMGGDVAAWVDYRHFNATTIDSLNSEIYLYDIVSKVEKRITTNLSYQDRPFTDGKRVVWIDYTDLTKGKLFMYTIATGETVEIAPSQGGKDNPRISGNYVTWDDYRSASSDATNSDIYIYDISTKIVQPLCEEKGFQGRSYLYDSLVAWEDYRNGNADIYGYNVQTQKSFLVTSTTNYEAHPTIYKNQLYWFEMGSAASSMKIVSKPYATESTSTTYRNSLTNPAKGLQAQYAGSGISISGFGDLDGSYQFDLFSVNGERIGYWSQLVHTTTAVFLPLRSVTAPGKYLLRMHGNSSSPTVTVLPIGK